MANKVAKLALTFVISVVIWVSLSLAFSWIFILYHGIECHIHSVPDLLNRHQVWTSFAIITGGVLPTLPNQIHQYVWHIKLRNTKALRVIISAIALCALVYGQLLDSPVFQACA